MYHVGVTTGHFHLYAHVHISEERLYMTLYALQDISTSFTYSAGSWISEPIPVQKGKIVQKSVLFL